MGILKLFPKPAPGLLRLPTGSLTVNLQGQVLTSTLPSACPPRLVEAIARTVLQLFEQARLNEMPLPELSIHFPSLVIIARATRNGAIIFVRPRN